MSKNCPWMSPHICAMSTSVSIRRREGAARTYRYGRVDSLYIALLNENLSCLDAEPLDLVFGDRLAALELLNLAELVRGMAVVDERYIEACQDEDASETRKGRRDEMCKLSPPADVQFSS